MRKVSLILLFFALFSQLFGGGGSKKATTEKKTITIGVSKIVSHPALDAVEKGVMDVVSAAMPDVKFDLQNANGDPNSATTIAQKFKSDKVDVAVGIATPTAQALVFNLDESTPILFAAVTDPVAAELVSTFDADGKNVTGTSDLVPVSDHVRLLKEIINLETLGQVYTGSEANGVTLKDMTQAACDENSIVFVPTSINTSAEVKQAALAIAPRVDAIYIANDNTVISALAGVGEVAMEAGIPLITSDPTSVEGTDTLVGLGFDYYKMGRATGEMILEILNGKNPGDMPTRFMTNVEDQSVIINLDTAKALEITLPDSLLEAAVSVIENGVKKDR